MRIIYNLKEGDKLTVYDRYLGKGRIRKCKVIRERTFYIEADFGFYHEAINKACEYCGDIRLGSGWKGEK